VGLAASPDGDGYWLASADGGVFAYGHAGFFGSMAGHRMGGRVVAIGAGFATEKPEQPVTVALSASIGFDISWPQCGKPVPAQPYGFGIVGVTGGRAFTTNPCLGDQVAWASAGGAGAGVYINLNSPR